MTDSHKRILQDIISRDARDLDEGLGYERPARAPGRARNAAYAGIDDREVAPRRATLDERPSSRICDECVSHAVDFS